MLLRVIVAIFWVNFSIKVDFIKASSAFPNIGYLGRGYDLLQSNPRPFQQSLDSGFARSIFDVSSHSLGRKTTDGKHLLPDDADVIECLSCQVSAPRTYIITGPAKYRKTLESFVKPEVDRTLDSAESFYQFRASDGYVQVVDETNFKLRTLLDTVSSCLVYCANLRQPSKRLKVEQAFIEAVNALPILSWKSRFISNTSKLQTSQLDVYFKFLHKFGTHYVSSFRAGSLYWQRATFGRSNFSRLEKDLAHTGIRSVARSTFLNKFISGNGSSEDLLKFEKTASSIFYNSIGAIPLDTHQGIYKTSRQWLQDSRENPMPVEIRLTPVTTLLNNYTFPNHSARDMAKKLEILTDLIKSGSYCAHLSKINQKVRCDPDGDWAFKNFEIEKETVLITKGSSVPTISSNYGATYFKADTRNFKDIPNYYSGIFDCPPGFKASLAGGGSYTVDSWPDGLCYPEGSAVPINKNIDLAPTLPGHFYICQNGSTDRENAFFGFHSVVNAPAYGPHSQWMCVDHETCCGDMCRHPGTTGRDTRPFKQRGQNEILVAFYGCEYIYASYSKQRGARVGGFYLVDITRPSYSWINPTTGVTSCPAGYTGHILFSQQATVVEANIFPFESFVCLLDEK